MKKFILVLLVMVFLPVTMAHAQLTVLAAATDALLAGSFAEQMIYYAQSLAQLVKTAEETVHMVEKMGNQIQMQMDNLENVSKVHNLKDFKSWYNRQIYLERRTEETFKDMNITIGKKKYNITDVEGMAYGFNDTYIDYWNKEFTEEQRREMWTNLGVTPSNYVYIQTWKAREQKIAHEFLAAREIQNEEYKKNMEQNKDKIDALEEDKTKDNSEKMGEKGVAVINAETNIASNKVLNDIRGDIADIKELKSIEIYQKNTPVDQPPMSEWPENGIQPLKK